MRRPASSTRTTLALISSSPKVMSYYTRPASVLAANLYGRGQVLEGELTRFAGFDSEVELSRSQETHQCLYGRAAAVMRVPAIVPPVERAISCGGVFSLTVTATRRGACCNSWTVRMTSPPGMPSSENEPSSCRLRIRLVPEVVFGAEGPKADICADDRGAAAQLDHPAAQFVASPQRHGDFARSTAFESSSSRLNC